MSARRQTRLRPRAVSLREAARPKPAQRGGSRRSPDCIARANSEALERPARQSLSREHCRHKFVAGKEIRRSPRADLERAFPAASWRRDDMEHRA